ncbi:glycoside hydrolase family 3 N-terminal domain-containing protein [Knoellia remsis]|nr:glycoside hydrolase family 3 N-terminal domain-containing protein [Knoellia remsis]
MTFRSATRVRTRRAALALALAGLLGTTACGSGDGTDEATSTPSSTSASPSTSTTAPSSSSSPSTSSPSASASASGSALPVSACVRERAEALSEEQALGQLVMVALDSGAAQSSLDDDISARKVGNVFLLGGWRDGAARVKKATDHLQDQATEAATDGIPLLIAADQEGGEIRQLRGDGFTKGPSAKVQGTMDPAELTAAATGWAKELKAAGINVNLAPVTDTVPADLGRANAPIGKWGRQYGSTPAAVTKGSTAFIKGMSAGGVMSTVKHFPGLGRVKNNTDFDSSGIVDSVATPDDPYLAPFMAGVEAGAGLVMMSSARYPGLDKTETQAMFSKPIITGLLREKLGYDGVVITDDLNAEAVRSIPAGKRAVDYISAGGDILLTGDAASVGPMVDALAEKARADEKFATLVETSVLRVVALKERMGLIDCG